MKPSEVKPGQVWRSNNDSCEWLVTKKYGEMFDSYAVLRKVGGSDSDIQRLHLERDPNGERVPGFTLIEG